MRVLGMLADLNGCGYYRMRLPLEEMAKNGHDVALTRTWVEQPDYDVVVAQRIGEPGEFERWRRTAEHAALVYEIDDDLFNVHPTNTQAYPQLSKPEVQEGMRKCIALSSLVTVSTKPLAEVVGQINPNVVVLPNNIHSDLLTLDREKRDRVTIGWSGGASHFLDFQSVSGQLRRFLDRNGSVDFHFIGADYSRLIRRECRFTPFEDDIFRFYKNIDFDIGVAPLDTNIFNKSKSHIRALEYAALGIPVVASDCEAYRDTVIDGVTGFLIKQDHEWQVRLRDLVNDKPMREEMGNKAREHARSWSIEQGWREWETTYGKVL